MFASFGKLVPMLHDCFPSSAIELIEHARESAAFLFAFGKHLQLDRGVLHV